MLELSEISEAIKNEIQQHYSNVSYKTYGNHITAKCVIRKLRHQEFIAHNTSTTVIDPNTFKTKQIHNVDLVQNYLVIGELFDDGNANIYKIYKSGPSIYQKEDKENEHNN